MFEEYHSSQQGARIWLSTGFVESLAWSGEAWSRDIAGRPHVGAVREPHIIAADSDYGDEWRGVGHAGIIGCARPICLHTALYVASQ
jgi:hypothetical protein